MADWLTNMDDTSPERKSRLPRSQFFFPNSIEKEEAREAAIESIKEADTLVLTDADADGLGAVLAVRQRFPDAAFADFGAHSRLGITEGLELTAEHMADGARVFIADISIDDIDDASALTGVEEKASHIEWWDHHEWKSRVADAVSSHVDVFVLDSEEPERCAAEIARDRIQEMGTEISPSIDEAITVIGVYDCWRKVLDENGDETDEFVDERARDLHDYAVIADDEQYLDALAAHGADIAESKAIASELAPYRREQEALKQETLKRATFHTVGDITVGITYGRGPKNDIASALKQQGATLAVVIRPTGGITFRSDSSFPYCAALARMFDGGGHETAAAAFRAPRSDGDTDRWDTDFLDYANYWETNGASHKDAVLDAVQRLVNNQSETT